MGLIVAQDFRKSLFSASVGFFVGAFMVEVKLLGKTVEIFIGWGNGWSIMEHRGALTL